MTSSSFFGVARPENSNFANFNPIKLKFGTEIDFGPLNSIPNSKTRLNIKFQRKSPFSLVFGRTHFEKMVAMVTRKGLYLNSQL